MKTITILVMGLMVSEIAQGQGTTYLSNLEQPSSGTVAVGSDQWLAELFSTGPNPGGYFLDSIQLAMQNASGAPIGFTVMVYTDAGFLGFVPGTSVGSLSGATSPTTAATYTYAPAQSLILSPNTPYFIVVTGGTGIANGAFEWSLAATTSYNPTAGWAVNQSIPIFRSVNGSAWTMSGGQGIFAQYAINATAVPEPGCFALFVLGGMSLVLLRRRNVVERAKPGW